MRTRLAATLVLCIAALGLGRGSALAVQADPEVVGIQLVAHPDQRDMGRRGLVSIVADVSAGTVVEREVIVSNDTQERQRLAVYVGGARVDGDGFNPDDENDLLASWSTTEPTPVTLAPGDKQRVSVRLDVPRDAVDGEHFGVVWVEPPAAGDDIRRVNRVGIRIYLTTSGGTPSDSTTAERLADFVIEQLTASRLPDGTPQVQASVRNTGNRTLDLVGVLSLRDGPGGTSAGPIPIDEVVTLGVGGTRSVTFMLSPELPNGPWTARVELASGATERAAEAVILFPEMAATQAEPVDAEMSPIERQRQTLIPIAGSLLLTLLVLLLVLWWGARRDREKAEHGDEPAENPTGAVA